MRKAHEKRQAGQAAATAKDQPAVKPASRCLFRIVAVLGIPLLLLLALEGVLRLFGYGYPTSFFLSTRMAQRAVLADNQSFGRRFFPPGLVRYPRPFTLADPKPAGALRIFVLGESAAMGDPDPKFGLPRMIEVLLREKFPERKIEVVNAAMVAINSHVILPIAKDCSSRQADLWLIYMGNNEIIGPFGSASVFGTKAPAIPVVRAGVRLKTTRVGQLMEQGLQLASGSRKWGSWGGMEMMAGQKISPHSTDTQRVYQNFRRNLRDILLAGTDDGVPVLLCTVASNLKDCAPFASLHRANLSTADLTAWERLYSQGMDLQSRGDTAAALLLFEKAADLDNEFADLSFRRAQCCVVLGRHAEGSDLFRKARDQDALQFRADSRVNGAIKNAALEFANRGATLFDSESLLATNSPQGLIGFEFFYEHVHLNPEGNYLVAKALAEKVAGLLSLPSEREWASQAECFRLLGLTDLSRYEAFETILDRIQGAPFTNQVNYAEELRTIKDGLARYRISGKPAQMKRDLQQIIKLVERYPEDPDLRWNLAAYLENTGDNAGAEQQWRALLAMQPQGALPRFNLGKLLDRLGRVDEACSLYTAGLLINPEYYQARFALGSGYLKLGRVDEALDHLRFAARQKPKSAEVRFALSEAYTRRGRFVDAERELKEVLRLDPGNAAALAKLKELQQASVRK